MTAIVGLMMLLAAEPVVQVVVVVLGISAILSGGFMLAAVAPLSDDKTFKTQCYIRAAVGIVIGILCVVIPLRVAQFAWQTMVCIFAVYSLASAILEIPIALTLRRDGLPVKRYAIEIWPARPSPSWPGKTATSSPTTLSSATSDAAPKQA